MTCEFPDDPRYVLARAIILEAAALAARHFDNLAALETSTKLNGQDVVTIADREVEALIRARIAAAYPDDGILGEEEGFHPGSSGYIWVVDPIDGTSCFLHGLRSWCISIAVMKGEETVLGLIQQPCTQDLFVAKSGRGAFLNGLPIAVDRRARIATGLLGVGANFRRPAEEVSRFIRGLLEAGGMFIRNGSGALMLAEVACGRLAGYYEPHINAWDCLAGLCLIREAGGWTADYPGSQALLAGAPVLAAAPQLREELLQLVAATVDAS
ncbi:MAG TPA: inositol monophosphatase [Dongiaceae bacterium]|nr:inositol monophosphatase [Dongiaceae bacterium]